MTPRQQVRNVLSVTNDFSGSFMQWIKYVGQPNNRKHFYDFSLLERSNIFLALSSRW